MNRLTTAQKKLLVRMGLLALMSAAVALVLYKFPPDHTRFYPRCLLYATTGLQCPGCGGLRAAHHLLHGHLAIAFHYNPLLILLLPVFGILGSCYVYARWRDRPVWPALSNPAWVWILVGGILVFSVVRNLA